jgi:thiamine-phosphate pyrophosphorylase
VEAVRAGAPWVHLRDHDAPPDAFADAARHLAARLRAEAPGVRLSVNTRLDVARALRAGLHLGWRGPSPVHARAALGPHALVGRSAHVLDEATDAEARASTYLFFSPVFPTTSKPGHPGAGPTALAAVCRAAMRPVLALGGVTPARVTACLDAGAHGVAVLSGIVAAPDPGAATRAYLDALARATR